MYCICVFIVCIYIYVCILYMYIYMYVYCICIYMHIYVYVSHHLLCVCVSFLGPHLWHMEIPRLGVESELQLLAYITAKAMQDLSYVCNLCHSSWLHWIFNPPREARDQTCIIMDTSQVPYR